MAGIRDVAREAGVAICTVSRLINGTANVEPETRKKIEDAMKKLNYVPAQKSKKYLQSFRKRDIINCVVDAVDACRNTAGKAWKTWLHGQAVKTSPFHGGNTGSIPVGVIFIPKEYADL